MYLSASIVAVSTWGAITSARPLLITFYYLCALIKPLWVGLKLASVTRLTLMNSNKSSEYNFAVKQTHMWHLVNNSSHSQKRWRTGHVLTYVYGESKKIPRGFSDIFPKQLGIFSPNFTHILNVPIYAGLQIFIQLSATLTKLCHIKHDHPVHTCSKCPPLAETYAGIFWHFPQTVRNF